MDGILDYLSNNWQSILGANPMGDIAGPSAGGAMQPPMPTRTPPPPMPSSVPGINDPSGMGMPGYMPPPTPMGQGGIGSDPDRNIMAGNVPMPMARPTAAPNSPMPGGMPAGQGGIGSDYATSVAQGGTAQAPPGAMPPAVPGAPLDINSPYATQGGNLGRALGLTGNNPQPGVPARNPLPGIAPQNPNYPYPRAPNPMQNFVGAIGQGMASAGAGAGNTKLGAFMRGFGGAVKGGIANNNQQEQQQLERQKNFFNETIANENQYIRNNTFPYNIQHLQASTNYLQGRANGGVGGVGMSNAWQLSDIGRMHMADQEADREYQNAVSGLRANTTAGLISPDDAQKRFEQLEQNKDQMRQNWYKRYRVDTSKPVLGSTQENPIDATKFSDEQLRTMPAGTYFKYNDQNGKPVIGYRGGDGGAGQYVPPSYVNVNSNTAATQAALQPGSDQAIQ